MSKITSPGCALGLSWPTISTAADIALMVDAHGIIHAVSVVSRALLRDIGDCESWLGRHWRETVTVQSRPAAESFLQEQRSNGSRQMRHVDHLLAGTSTVPITYSPLPLDAAGADGRVLLLGRDLRGMDFTNILLHADPAAASAYAKALSAQGTDAEALCLDVLAPAARRLGILWSEDACSFVEVTVGLGSLHQIIRELAPSPRESDSGVGQARRILLALAPGEQHSFGLSIVREFFIRAGWAVNGGASLPVRNAMRLIREDDYDVVGLSAAGESRLSALTAAIRRLRSTSRNRAIRVMVGGQIFADRPELAAEVGADTTARDGRHAVLEAERLSVPPVCKMSTRHPQRRGD